MKRKGKFFSNEKTLPRPLVTRFINQTFINQLPVSAPLLAQRRNSLGDLPLLSNSFEEFPFFFFLSREASFEEIKKKKKKNECTRATGNAGAGDESSALPRRMPSAGSWNATRRPDPLTAGQKLLLPLALPLGPLLHSQLYSALA